MQTEVVCLMYMGRSFHSFGAQFIKEASPLCVWIALGTIERPAAKDLSAFCG